MSSGLCPPERQTQRCPADRYYCGYALGLLSSEYGESDQDRDERSHGSGQIGERANRLPYFGATRLIPVTTAPGNMSMTVRRA